MIEFFSLFKKIRLPFDWKTPFGFTVALLSQIVGGCATFSILLPAFSFMIGSCVLFIFVADDITKDLAVFNSGKVAKKNRVPRLKRFCAIIEIHSDARQLGDYEMKCLDCALHYLMKMCIYSFSLGSLRISNEFINLRCLRF